MVAGKGWWPAEDPPVPDADLVSVIVPAPVPVPEVMGPFGAVPVAEPLGESLIVEDVGELPSIEEGVVMLVGEEEAEGE